MSQGKVIAWIKGLMNKRVFVDFRILSSETQALAVDEAQRRYPKLKWNYKQFIAGVSAGKIYLGKGATQGVIMRTINHETVHLVLEKILGENESAGLDHFLYYKGEEDFRKKIEFCRGLL